MKGVFISLEGIEGTGKSTQSRLLASALRALGRPVTETAEPGGTPISLRIREILLSTDSLGMIPLTELLLYNAARVQHIEEVIAPALTRGEIVITDRFSDSTVAYQGYGRDIDLKLIDSLDAVSTNRLRPDLTVLLDLDAETGLRRNKEINKDDRLEREDISFHEKVRRGFISIAAKESDRVRIIDCSEGIGEVHKKIVAMVTDFLGSHAS
ncbi:MAG: dTMP kinase [Nitrospirae bacterium]|nr:dTMP kinase [Nitrospirota bacterium]